MIKIPFIGLTKPVLRVTPTQFNIVEVPIPKRATLLLEQSGDHKGDYAIKIGDNVKSGSKIQLFADDPAYTIATVTGTIASIQTITGNYGKKYIAVTIEQQGEDLFCKTYQNAVSEGKFSSIQPYLSCLPGSPTFNWLSNSSVDTIIINGMDQDLLVNANQFAVQENPSFMKAGVKFLKRLDGILQVFLVVPERMLSSVNTSGAEIIVVDETYPNYFPNFILKDFFGKELAADETPESIGFTFISGQSVAAIGSAIHTGQLPLNKIVTVIDKDGKTQNVTARIGTPIRDVFQLLGIHTQDGDRIIMGCPMRGIPLYSEDLPILPTTDALMVQDKTQLSLVSDYPCINCGECIRICPVHVPVNLLVRYLENAQYEDAMDLCDLNSCIECGLCSFVCPSKMPIFQYIMLGKYELSQQQKPEAEDE